MSMSCWPPFAPGWSVNNFKSNYEVAAILGNTESTVKKHVGSIFVKLGLETRHAASVRALEVLSAARS